MSQGIAQQCNDILVLGDLRNGSKLSNYSASSPPICKHDFARRSASASATSLSVSVNGQGVKPGRWYLRIACDCLRAIRVVLVAALARGKPSRPWPLAAPPFHSMLLQSQSTASRRRPKARPRCFHGAALPTGSFLAASPLRTRPRLRQATWRGRGRRLRGPGVGPRFFESPYAPLRVTRRWAKRRP